jgi:hypothetical protein
MNGPFLPAFRDPDAVEDVMAENAVRPDKLLLTEAERVPPPRAATAEMRDTAHSPEGSAADDPRLLEELRRLAERAGGVEQLRRLLDSLND